MNERDDAFLRDMLDAAQKAQRFVTGKIRETLYTDDMLSFAVVRALEIIGEAASKISVETRTQNPQIEWKNIVGMRNRIIHDYNNVNLDIVWKTVVEVIPELITQLVSILPPLTDGPESHLTS